MKLYDAHNHLQDERFKGTQANLMREACAEGVAKMVVNGSRESDWNDVLTLARHYASVIPSIGYHPWYVHERSNKWQENLITVLDTSPCAIGEVGLDCWIKDFDISLQEELFKAQLIIAAERNLPVSIHCLKAWGRMLDILQCTPLPACGFLLHSYGGSEELIRPLAKLGAYFSFPGYFAHARKEKQRAVFRHVPAERLLVESDAPEQLLPDTLIKYPLQNSHEPLNHPANLIAVYQYLACFLETPLGTLCVQIEENFTRLFGDLISR